VLGRCIGDDGVRSRLFHEIQRAWQHSGEQAGSRRPAEWELTERLGEHGAAFGKGIDIRRTCVGMRVGVANPVVQIVDRDEQYVR